MYERASGVPKDELRAAHFCAGGDAQGCNRLAILLATGVGGDADPAQAVQLYERACELGATLGCAAGAIPSAPVLVYSGEVPLQVVQPPGPSNLHR
jgi:TPR repeat protein